MAQEERDTLHRISSEHDFDSDLVQVYTDPSMVYEELRRQAPDSGDVLPYQFFNKTLGRIGGRVWLFSDSVGYALPTPGHSDHQWVAHFAGVRVPANRIGLNGDQLGYFALSDKDQGFAGETVSRFTSDVGIISLAHPTRDEAVAAREIQRVVWGIKPEAEEQLYPYHLYHPNAGLATRLIAKTEEGEVIGFLIGFYGRSDNQWMGAPNGAQVPGIWIESQLLGVLPEYRRHKVGKMLKLQQYNDAREDRIALIGLTFDPLNASNAEFNYNTLGIIGGFFRANYYKYRTTNQLNQVAASRVRGFCFTQTDRPRLFMNGEGRRFSYEELMASDIQVVQPEVEEGVFFNADQWIPSSAGILIEIPGNWKDVQDQSLERAQEWRRVTDILFAKTVGAKPGQYLITQLVRGPKGEPYLVLRRADPSVVKLIFSGE